jgi:two-component system phosphate regulon response regulator PhoB
MAIKVLIADDEPNQIELISYNLKQSGFEVFFASDGQQALHMAESQLPDIVILDWMMPAMSGIEVCKALRSMAETRSIPVIMLSARGEEGDRTLGLDIGADDYMTKPFSPKELVARIHAVLRRARPILTSEVIEYGSLRLYPAKKIVERDGKRVDLGPKEFRILSLLMERPGQVFSRTQLLDHVWGHGIYIDDRTIDVHMSRLRKALQRTAGETPLSDLIRTVRGSGYALSESE